MGNGGSSMSNGDNMAGNMDRQAKLLQDIMGVAQELQSRYKSEYLSPKFCDKIALVYNDKLMSFRKQEINGVAMTLGIAVEDADSKTIVCNKIVQHFTGRMKLVSAIEESLGFCANRIYGLVSGPRCEGNPEVFDAGECEKSRGRWLPTVVPPDGTMSENSEWYKIVFAMQNRYLESLSSLYDILTRLKDFSEELDDSSLESMAGDVSQLIDVMQESCGQLYKLALTTPTSTPSEVRLRQEAQSLKQKEQAAKKAALRSVRGLQAVKGQK